MCLNIGNLKTINFPFGTSVKLIHLGFSVHNHNGEVVDDNSEVEIFSIKHKWVIVREHTVLGEDPV